MGQQQGKQPGPPMSLPPMEAVANIMPPANQKPQSVSKIKGLKSRQNKDLSADRSWSAGAGQALGAGPPSVAVLGMFNELSQGKTIISLRILQMIFTYYRSKFFKD